ncbi:MAG TPA: DUF4112 domain-containing protein [Thermoanaerobaculia bacterium]
MAPERLPARPRPLEPEVLPRGAPDPWVERLAWLMDRSIPIGGRWAIGLDAIIGLVPGLGDLIGALVSAAIVVSAVRARLPRSAIARMVANVAIDAVVGAVPLAGDVFDAAWQANVKNVRIYREALRQERSRTVDSLFVVGVILAFVLMLAIPVVVIVLLVKRL